jgi:hypothetical protein
MIHLFLRGIPKTSQVIDDLPQSRRFRVVVGVHECLPFAFEPRDQQPQKRQTPFPSYRLDKLSPYLCLLVVQFFASIWPFHYAAIC